MTTVSLNDVKKSVRKLLSLIVIHIGLLKTCQNGPVGIRLTQRSAAAAGVPRRRTEARTVAWRSRSSEGGSPKYATISSSGISTTAAMLTPARNG